MLDQELTAIHAMRELLASEPEPMRRYDPAAAKAILKASGWSAESVARVLSVSTRSVAGWLAGEHQPSHAAESWQKLIALLDRVAAVRSTRLQEGVERLLQAVRDEQVAA